MFAGHLGDGGLNVQKVVRGAALGEGGGGGPRARGKPPIRREWGGGLSLGFESQFVRR